MLLFTPAPCTCCIVSDPAPKCPLCGILCASIVAIHTQSSEINTKSGMGVNCNLLIILIETDTKRLDVFYVKSYNNQYIP